MALDIRGGELLAFRFSAHAKDQKAIKKVASRKMAKAKSKATIMVADGAGGMMKVSDRRFETEGWPVEFDVPIDVAETWFRYVSAEIEKRGWSQNSLSQHERRENSGTITVRMSSGAEQFSIVWERKLDGPIRVRARFDQTQGAPPINLNEFFEQLNQKSQQAITESFYRQGQLAYTGLPWRGELWLDIALRLGPPSQQYEIALLGPRILLVDAMVEAVGPFDTSRVFGELLQEVSAFLSVAMGQAVRLPGQGQVWTWAATTEGVIASEVRTLGYIEQVHFPQMPEQDRDRPVPRRQVNRPDSSMRGIEVGDTEISAPEDIGDLWKMYRDLKPARKWQFLQVAAKFQEAMTLWRESRTLSFSLLVVSCEALKPSGKSFNRHKIYDVVEALLGKPVATKLKQDGFRAHHIRSTHLHLGEFHGSEFIIEPMGPNYYDPTFDEAHRELTRVAQAAIIEWLRRGGVVELQPIP